MARRAVDEEISQGLFTYEADEVGEVISTLPSRDKKIALYRVNPQGRSSYVAEFFPEDFSLSYIKENYGGGKFSIVADTADGPKKMRFEMEGDPKIEGGQRLSVRKIVNGQQYMISGTERELIQQGIIAPAPGAAPGLPAPAAGNDSALLMAYIQRLESKLDNLQNATPNRSREDWLKELVMMKEIFTANQPQSAGSMAAAELSNVIKMGIELGTRAANGDVTGGGSIWETLIDKALPVVTQVLAQAQRNAAIPAQAQPNNGHQNNGAEKILPRPGIADMLPGGMDTQPAQTSSPFAELFRPYLPLVVASAAKNNDPISWAEIITNNIPPQHADDVIGWLASPHWLNELTAIDPRIAAQESWWLDLSQELKSFLTTGGPIGQPDDEKDDEQ